MSDALIPIDIAGGAPTFWDDFDLDDVPEGAECVSASGEREVWYEHTPVAGDTAEEATVPFRDLPLYERAEPRLADAAALVAGVAELRERLQAGLLGSDARYDLGLDLYEQASRLQTFALEVMCGVQP